jgi:hypothetical protein
MAETHTTFYTASDLKLETWTVEKHTARTWLVARQLSRGYTWRRTVRSADIGVTWHITPVAALAAKAREIQGRIDSAKRELQTYRTSLGIVESQLRKLGAGALIDQPASVDAVDPVEGVVEGCPRATKNTDHVTTDAG